MSRHTAAVLRTEADVRRQSDMRCDRAFASVLDTWAANAERRALEADRANSQQMELF
jgi:hypothetical protein